MLLKLNISADHYLLFDFPGQVELFFLHSNARSVVNKLIKKMDLRVCVCSWSCLDHLNANELDGLMFFLYSAADCCASYRCPFML